MRSRRSVRGRGRVAVVSCPTAHRALCRAGDAASVLFEFDARCGANLGDRFCRFDFNEDFEAKIPSHFENAFDVVVLDPPYVSQDCLEAFWSFAAWLSKGAAAKLVLTSVVNRPWLRGLGPRADGLRAALHVEAVRAARAFTDSEAVAAKLRASRRRRMVQQQWFFLRLPHRRAAQGPAAPDRAEAPDEQMSGTWGGDTGVAAALDASPRARRASGSRVDARAAEEETFKSTQLTRDGGTTPLKFSVVVQEARGNFVHSPSSSGACPTADSAARRSSTRCSMTPMLTGPNKLLSSNRKTLNSLQYTRSAGMAPSKSFSARSKCSRATMLPMSPGILPDRALPLRFKTTHVRSTANLWDRAAVPPNRAAPTPACTRSRRPRSRPVWV